MKFLTTLVVFGSWLMAQDPVTDSHVPTSRTIDPRDASIVAGCTIGVDGSSVLASTFALSIPMERTFLGLTLAVQGFEFRGIGPCLQRLHFSDTIDCRVQ